MSFSQHDRATMIRTMTEETFDLVIVGGGINGAGVARDAASRGLRVAVIEANDFAFGTSSRSSKLIHGGIRYLENFEFGLVFEALSERQRLFELAPHLVHPLQFMIPLYEGGRVAPWKMGAGLWLYDALSLFEAPELHAFWHADELKLNFPSLQQNGLLGGFSYSDAYMDDDRLVFETMRSAHDFGAHCANYVKATSAIYADDKVCGLQCEDILTGRKFALKGHHFVGSVGPWTDIFGASLFEDWKKVLRPSKGVHLTFSRERLPLPQAVVMAAEARIVFGIPRNEMVIIGTTDTDFAGDPASVTAERADIDYLLRVTNQYFPGANIIEKDIIASYAGVRPLVRDGSDSESKTSREHVIWTDPRNVTFVAGGKYTTYRNMAEQTVDQVLAHSSFAERSRFGKTQTVSALNPLVTPELLQRARAGAKSLASQFHVAPSVTEQLVERHGLEAEEILRKGLPVLSELGVIRSDAGLLWGLEAVHACSETMCLSLTDFYFRRTPLVLSQKDHGLEHMTELAAIMGEILGWTSEHRQVQINALQKQLSFELGWQLTRQL